MSHALDSAAGHASPAEVVFDALIADLRPDAEQRMLHWMGWRLRLLVIAALMGCIAFFLLARELTGAPHIDASWRIGSDGRVELAASTDPSLREHIGQAWVGVSSSGHAPVAVDAFALRHSARWLIDDALRNKQGALNAQLAQVMAGERVTLHFSDGGKAEPHLSRRGAIELGSVFWLLGAFALMLYLVAMVMLFARPGVQSLLYAVMALCQTTHLVLMAIDAATTFGIPAALAAIDAPLRLALDLITCAAIVTAAARSPRRLRGAEAIIAATWITVMLLIAGTWQGIPSNGWWWRQGAIVLLAALALVLVSASLRAQVHPFAMALRRFGAVAWVTYGLLTLGMLAAQDAPHAQYRIAESASLVWYTFFALLLLLLPFLSKSQQILREFSLLAAISTVATSLDLLFVAVFSLGQFASLTLSLFVSLGVYAGVRQWMLNRLLGESMLTTERTFEQLYRLAREVEAHPQRAPALLSRLLHDLFDPMEASIAEQSASQAGVFNAGTALCVPVPQIDGHAPAAPAVVVLRFAKRGRRLFTSEDARLADRITEQLRRAVAFDKAVEQGRSEERTRIAQDLHDDIGARLLTLMYKSSTPEMEEYVRHTLKDLKTLTRGLAASQHRLSDAAAEWKSDLTQRLAAAHIELDWKFTLDDDPLLSVVQWSGLTRVLRELVSNTIAHSKARRVEIALSLVGDGLTLSVTDDGVGREPQSWSHGLGLGGVRKRVKQLGGDVEWTENAPAGICCRVTLRQFSSPSDAVKHPS